ncbi:MAG TPA: hypothetical protein PLY81_00560, partial [Chitinophagaceae bacterium]|nr:hypothetical protein [Chitinophagaceae bacterium]
NMAYFFLAKANENLQCQQPDPFEDLDVILVDKKEVLEMIHNSQIIHGVQIGAIYAAYQKLGWIEQKI